MTALEHCQITHYPIFSQVSHVHRYTVLLVSSHCFEFFGPILCLQSSSVTIIRNVCSYSTVCVSNIHIARCRDTEGMPTHLWKGIDLNEHERHRTQNGTNISLFSFLFLISLLFSGMFFYPSVLSSAPFSHCLNIQDQHI